MKIDGKSLFIGLVLTVVLSIVFMKLGLMPIVAGVIGGITGMCIGIVIRNAVLR